MAKNKDFVNDIPWERAGLLDRELIAGGAQLMCAKGARVHGIPEEDGQGVLRISSQPFAGSLQVDFRREGLRVDACYRVSIPAFSGSFSGYLYDGMVVAARLTTAKTTRWIGPRPKVG